MEMVSFALENSFVPCTWLKGAFENCGGFLWGYGARYGALVLLWLLWLRCLRLLWLLWLLWLLCLLCLLFLSLRSTVSRFDQSFALYPVVWLGSGSDLTFLHDPFQSLTQVVSIEKSKGS